MAILVDFLERNRMHKFSDWRSKLPGVAALTKKRQKRSEVVVRPVRSSLPEVNRRVDEIMQELDYDEIVEISDRFIDAWPDWMPKFTARRHHRMRYCRVVIQGQLLEKGEFMTR